MTDKTELTTFTEENTDEPIQEKITGSEPLAEEKQPIKAEPAEAGPIHYNSDFQPSRSEKEKPVKRIGTFTMGLSLIYTGVLILCSAIIPDFNIITALKFMPAILILLGGELIVSCFWGKERKVKYDLLGSIISLVLICGSLTASALANAYQYYHVERIAEGLRIENSASEKYSEKIAKTGLVSDINVYASIYQGNWDAYRKASDEDKNNISRVSIDIVLWNGHASKEEFAEDCYKVMEALGGIDRPAYISFRQDDGRYRLELNSRLKQSMEKSAMVKLVVDNEQEDEAL